MTVYYSAARGRWLVDEPFGAGITRSTGFDTEEDAEAYVNGEPQGCC